jgi:hypothetical protein
MANSPRKDNVVRFRQQDRSKPGRTPSGSSRGWRALVRGREGWVGLALIVVIAVAIVAWQRLAG